MASKSVPLSTTVYTKLDTGTDTAVVAQNRGASNVRIVFSASLPAFDSEADFLLKPGQALARDSMVGNMNALAETPDGAKVTVGE
jgi:hypothetical protein